MEERKRPEAPRASSGVPGYQTLRVGSHVVAQVPGTDQSAPVWKPGNVSSWDREQGYTVVFRDGSFMPLATCLCFSVQRLSRASALSPGTPVLVPAVPESQVAFLAGVVVSCDQHTAQIVFGTQGKDWEWVQVEPGNTVPGAVRHVNGFLASLSTHSEPRSVPVQLVHAGIHWLQFEAPDGHVRVSSSVLYAGDSLSLRWDVPASQTMSTPMMDAQSILAGAGRLFDLDGDSALSVGEYNTYIVAACAPPPSQPPKDPSTAEADAAKAKHQLRKWIVKDDGMPRVARRAGLDVEVGQPLPLAALPTLWQAGAATRAAASSAEVSAHDVLLKELANVLLVRFEVDAPDVPSGMKSLQTSLPKLFAAAASTTGIAASAAVVSWVKECGLTGIPPPAAIMASLREAVAQAVVRAPQIVAAFLEGVAQAAAAAPEMMRNFRDQVFQGVDAARTALLQAGHAAHASILAGARLSAQLVVACEEALRNGASLAADTIAKIRGFFTRGGDPEAAREGGVLGQITTELKNLLQQAISAMRLYCNRETLEELQAAAAAHGAEAVGVAAEVVTTVREAAATAIRDLPAVSVDREAVLASASESAQAARSTAGAAGDESRAVLTEAAAVASAAVPVAVALVQTAATQFNRLLHVAAERGIEFAPEARSAVMETLTTGQDAVSPSIEAVRSGLDDVARAVAPALLATTMAALSAASDAVPALEALGSTFQEAVANSPACVAILADVEAVDLMGGAGAAGKLAASTAKAALATTSEAGAIAATHLVSAAATAAAASAVAAAEIREAAAQAAVNAAEAAGTASEAAQSELKTALAVAAAGASQARAAAARTTLAGLQAVQRVSQGAALDDARVVAQAAAHAALLAAASAASRAAAVASVAGNAAVQASAEATGMVVVGGRAGLRVLASVAEPETWEGMAAMVKDARSFDTGDIVDLATASRGVAQQSAQAVGDAALAAVAALGPDAEALAREAIQGAAAAREAVVPGVRAAAAVAAASARAVVAAAAAGASAASEEVATACTAAMQALPPDAAARLHATLAAGANTGAVVLRQVATATADAARAGGTALRHAPIGELASAVASTAAAGATLAAAAAGELADGAGDVAGAVAPAAAAALSRLGDAASPGFEAAGDFLGSAGAAVAGVAGAGVGAVAAGVEEAKDAVVGVGGVVLENGERFFESALAKGGDLVQWDTVSDVYSMSREAVLNLAVAAMAVGASCAVCARNKCFGMDLIKMSIVRDFFQMLGLFFASMASKAMELSSQLWGNLSNLISVDINFVVPSISPLVIYIAIGVVALVVMVCFLVFMCMASSTQPDAIREGHETMAWDTQAEKRKHALKFLRFFLTACFSVYLPVSRSIFQILVCESTMGRLLEGLGLDLGCVLTLDADIKTEQYECACSDWSAYIYLQIAAVVLLLGFTVSLPLKCYFLIRDNKPIGSREDPAKRYDEDGHLVEFTDHMYNMDIMTDPRQLKCPYLFLYKGYERRWAYYQVLVMVFKFILCIPVIVLWNRVVIQTCVTLLLLAVYCIFSFYSTPFINPHADGMDASARVTAVATVMFGLLGSDEVFGGASTAFAVLIHVANGINIVMILIFTLAGFPKCRSRIQNMVGSLSFEDTCLNVDGPAHKIIPNWQVEREVKHRLWHAFWDSLAVNCFSDAVQDRILELKNRVADVGKHRVVQHFAALQQNPVRHQQRRWVEANLEGVDVYFDGVPLDGKLDSKTKFAKMYINPFPFEIVLAYDDSDDVNMLFEVDFDKFVNQNRDPDIVVRRNNRRICRALALTGEQVYYPHQRTESHSVPDGTETYTDSEGKTHTRTRYTTVQVLMTYTNGVMRVTGKNKKAYARGFYATLSFSDGHGVAIAPHTGKHHQIRNSHTMTADEFGLDRTFRMSPGFQRLVSGNGPKISAALAQLTQKDQAYRQALMSKRRKAEEVLDSGYWFFVYDNVSAMDDRPQLERYLLSVPALAPVVTEHKAGLGYLYGRLKWVNSHPCSRFWWLFFDNIWDSNRDLKVMQSDEAQAFFDTRSSQSVAYHPMPRAKLEAKLEELGVRNISGCRGSKKYFNDNVLDILYNKMEETDALVRLGSAAVEP